ncbi:MAG: chorismate mutase [Alphaproteobacteria bacterium]
MNSAASRLDDLRRDIDAIDTQIHDLVMRRAEVSAAISRLKGENGGAPYQPLREAAILNRLFGRHRGNLPVASLFRLWREIIGASTRLQCDFSVAVFYPEGTKADAGLEIWSIVRDHFAGGTPLVMQDSAAQVVNAVATGEASVGVLPLPRDGDLDPWWVKIRAQGPKIPSVVAKLPMIGPIATGDQQLLVMALGVDTSGSDRRLVAIECETQTSRSGLQDGLVEAGLDPALCVAWEDAQDGGRRVHLADIRGVEPLDGAMLATVERRAGTAIRAIVGLGGYALPLAEGKADGSWQS